MAVKVAGHTRKEAKAKKERAERRRSDGKENDRDEVWPVGDAEGSW